MNRIILITLIILVFSTSVLAQDSFDICSPENAAPALNSLVAAIDPSTQEAWLSGVVQVRTLLMMIEQDCLGLGPYSSEEYGLQPVLDPVAIPAGVYRVTFTTTGFGTVDAEVLDGSCSADGFSENLFIVSSGQADTGAQITFESKGCIALIAVSNTSEPWSLAFEAFGISSE